MNRRAVMTLSAVLAAGVPAVLVLGQQQAAPDAEAVFERIAASRERLATIDRRAMRVDDLNAIENLQRSYGYYTDKMLWEHVVDLFTDDGTLEIGDSGVYVGKDSIRRYLYAFSGGEQGPLEGVLYNHLQLQPIVSIADDGRAAQGRWRALILTGVHGEGSGGNWGEGVYENEYAKERGIWKISRLRFFPTFIAPYEGGWLSVRRDAVRQYSRPAGVEPDRPPSDRHEPYPAGHLVPFHYPNPVSNRAFEPRGD